jgi:hypothetical protein
MDLIAKAYWQALNSFPLQYFDLPQDHQWSVAIQGRQLTSFDKSAIIEHIYGPGAKEY